MAGHRSALIGKAGEVLVMSELLRRQIDVAVPAYDGGVDLIAYRHPDFRKVVPIQVKTASGVRFNFQKAWFRVEGLVLIHVWNVQEGTQKVPQFYIFNSLNQVEQALGARFATSASWREKGGYSVTSPGSETLERMKPHRDKWDRIVERLESPIG